MGSHHVSLHWNGHKDNMVTMFKQLLSGECLVDVTLESEGHHVKAHKIILSASSPFFQNLFVDNPCHHPTVVLTNIIKYENMKAIVDFVYQGKIDVSRERLGEFLKSAERLKIKGLSAATQDDALVKNVATNDNTSNDSLVNTFLRNNQHQMQSSVETSLTFLECNSSHETENTCQDIKIVKVEGSYKAAEKVHKKHMSWEDTSASTTEYSAPTQNSKPLKSSVFQETSISNVTADKKIEDMSTAELSVKVEVDDEAALNSMQVCIETEEPDYSGVPDQLKSHIKVEEVEIYKDQTNESSIKQQVVNLLNGPAFYQEVNERDKRELMSAVGSYAAIANNKSSGRILRPNLRCTKESGMVISKYSSSPNISNTVKKMSSPGLRFSCNTCGRMFKWRSHLAIHQMSHMNEKPIYCDVCGGVFMRKTLLKLHMKVHGKQKVYTCDICGKSFLTETNLIIHNRTHTGEKPYDCNICGKKFTQKGNLAGHLRTHIGERPYICNVCNKRFTQNVGLRKHLYFSHCSKT